MSYVTDRIDEQVFQLLKSGGVGFMPSDTINGLSCKALDKSTVEKVYALKGRSRHKPFIILISDTSQLSLLGIDEAQIEPVKKYWPGQLTIICDASSSPEWLERGTKSLAIRLPANENLRKLINAIGPIISTSANIEGRPPAKSVNEAIQYFGEKLDFYVDVGELPNNQPSTIVKVNKGKLEVIRQGSIVIQ